MGGTQIMSEALLIFFLLAIKHGVCDLALQALYCRPSNKHRYFSGRAHLHALHHGLGTLLVTVFFASMPLALLLALMDYLLHWHIDFVKSTLVKWFNYTLDSDGYWLLTTVDQNLHFATYLLIVLLI